MSEELPEAKELYKNHKEHAEAVERVGEFATGHFELDGSTEQLSETVLPNLREAAEKSKKDLELKDEMAGKVVSEHQDVYEAEAKADMEAEAEQEHRYYAKSRSINEERIKESQDRGISAEIWVNAQEEAESEANKAAAILGPDKLAQIAKTDMEKDSAQRDEQKAA